MTTTDTPRDKAPMDHIGLDVSHLERAKPFSQVILGCQVLGESPQEGRRCTSRLTNGMDLRRDHAMKVLSVNVGRPREVSWKGRAVTTSIFKVSVAGRVQVRTLNLDGDQQADRSVHGGPDKAVYIYPAEHYDAWRGELPGTALPWSMFGENLTTAGLLEEAVHIGDTFRIGSAVVTVTQPRLPCYKLGLEFGRPDLIKRFLASGRSGFYVAVVREGEVEAGDTIELLRREASNATVADLFCVYAR